MKKSIIKFMLIIAFMFIGMNGVLAAEEGTFGNAGWGGGNNKCWWQYSDNGVLTIRPLNSANNEGGCYVSKWYDNNTSSLAEKTQQANKMYQWPWLKYKNQIKKIVMTGKFYTADRLNFNKLFEGYPLLQEFDSSGLQLSTATNNTGQTFFSKVEQANSMFANCPELVRVDLSGFTNNSIIWDIRKMFANDPKLTTVIMNNANFKTRASASNGIMMSEMFAGSDNVEYVDFSNVTFNGRPSLHGETLTYLGFENLFKGKTKLHTVLLKNTKVDGVKSFESLFEDCTSLNYWNGTKGLNLEGFTPKNAIDMRNMFKGCTGFTKLNLSSFGKLNNVVNMDGLIEGCSNLEELVLDNLDNSVIGPYSTNHAINLPSNNQYPKSLYTNNKKYDQPGDVVTRSDSLTTGAIEYGREIFGKGIYDIPVAFPKLTKISAKNSNIWMVKNNRGVAGNEYYNAGSDIEILYLFNTKTNLTPDGKDTIVLDSKRDYIDMITDRDGIKAHAIIPGVATLPDASENLNIKYNYNLNGAGHLAAGVYEITNEAWNDDDFTHPDTYYRIAYIGNVPFKIEGIDTSTYGQNGTDPELVLQMSNNFAWLNTRSDINWPTSGSYTIDRTNNPIKITYEDAAIDVNGKKHNVVITITKITFKNLERIPTHAGSTVIHDPNRYIDFHPTSSSNAYNQSQWATTNTGYYRTILSASRSEGVNFRNYIRVGDGNIRIGSENDWQVLSGGSGTDIDFTISIEKANPNTSFIFHGKDLDIAESQDWIRPNNDHDYEYLPIENNTYGIGGEGFVLGEGNDLSTVKFAKHTGLKLVSAQAGGTPNTVITTGSDPNTTWSEFGVKANANGAKYTWQSGIGCNTYALINTPSQALGKIEIQPIAKVLQAGTLQKNQFEFTLEPDTSVINNKATGATVSAKNDENGNVLFDSFKFETPNVVIDSHTYYPGTINDATNTHGEGTHNKFTYAWIVREVDGGDKNIEYDLAPKKLKVIISTPENDIEALKGIKAEVYVDEVLVNTVWSKDVENNKIISGVTFKNTLLKEITLKVNWDDNDDEIKIRPEDLAGFIEYESLSMSRRVNTISGNWTKSNNSWIYKFLIPADATVTKWGETVIPAEYGFILNNYVAGSNIFEMTNPLKKYDLTIKKVITGTDINKNKEFGLTIKLYDRSNNLIKGKFNALINNKAQELTSDENGIVLKIKNSDIIIIKELTSGYSYEILEEDTDYTEYYSVVANNKVLINTTEGNNVKGILKDNTTVTLTNNKDKVVVPESKPVTPAVVKTLDDIIIYSVALGASIFVIIVLYIYMKKKKK